MTLFSASNISKSYFEKVLFTSISFGLQDGERVGIIGKNGVGKSTLLRIVAGLEEPDDGIVAFNNEARFEYLEQLPMFTSTDGGDPRVLDTVVAAYPSDHAHMEIWEIETLAKQFLGKLGVNRLDDRVETLSGGLRKRVALARSIVSDPDLLILDEPTNHLDADSVQWLQDYLMNSSKGLLLVTHDRYFLDAVCTRIIEIDQEKLISYDGSYEYYLEKKEALVATQEATADHMRNKLRTELAWLQKGAKARRTKQRSRIDWIAKMQAEPERPEEKNIKIELGARFLGGKIIDAVDISKSIGGRLLFKDFTYRATPKDRIGIIGPNGAGKSTLLNVLAGRGRVDGGYVDIGDTVSIGFFDQEIRDMRDDATVLATLREVAEYIDVGVGRDRFITAKELCERFLFSAKQQHAYVHTLSGGEKRRLALLRILMKNPNVIMLDEPTNDFDIMTLSALEDFLQHFYGVLLIVSHDRSFLDKTVNTIYAFEEGGVIKEYPGNYSVYLEKKEARGSQANAQQRAAAASTTSTTPTPSAPSKQKLSYKEQKELDSCERRIADREARRTEIERALGDTTADYKTLQSLAAELQVIMNEIETITERWLELSEKMQ
jgi:ATP-binding cassette subfamily F protein uup